MAEFISNQDSGTFNDSRDQIAPVTYQVSATNEHGTFHENIIIDWGCFSTDAVGAHLIDFDDEVPRERTIQVTAIGPAPYNAVATEELTIITQYPQPPMGNIWASTLYPDYGEVYTINWTSSNGTPYVFFYNGSLIISSGSSGSLRDAIQPGEMKTYTLKVINRALMFGLDFASATYTVTVDGGPELR